MSILAPFLTPTASSEPLVRARLRLLASRLDSLGPAALPPAPLAAFTHPWLAALQDAAGGSDLTAAWRDALARLGATEVDAALAPDAVERVLQGFTAHLPDADLLTASAMLEHARQHLRLVRAAGALQACSAAMAGEAVTLLRGVFARGDGADIDVDFAAVEAALAGWLAEWCELVRAHAPDRAALLALAAFLDRVGTPFTLPLDAWQLLLQKLESLPLVHALGAPPLVETLTAALPRLELLRALPGALASAPACGEPASAALAPLASLQIVLAMAPRAAPSLAAAALAQPDVFAAFAATSRAALGAGQTAVRDALRRDLEQFQVDAWVDAVGWIERLAAVPAAVATQQDAIEARLAPALQAEADPKRLTALGLAMVATAARFGAAALDPADAPVLFRRHLVSDLGADPAAAPWPQAPALARALAGAITPAGLPPPLLTARTCLRGFDSVVASLAGFPLGAARTPWRRALEAVAASAGASVEDCGQALRILQRLAIEHRLARPHAAIHALLPWLATPPAARAGSIARLWTAASEAMAGQLPDELLFAAQRLQSALPAVTAAQRLALDHEAIGLAAAQSVWAKLPDYAAATGEGGRSRCARDNALTLLKLSRVLLAPVEDHAEALGAWWNAVIAGYVINRPPSLFEANLQGLHDALRAHLAPAEFNVVFPILHQLYKEGLGIHDSPLLTFAEFSEAALPPGFAPAAAPVWTPENAPALRTALSRQLPAIPGHDATLAPAFARWLEAATPVVPGDNHVAVNADHLRPLLAQWHTQAGAPRVAGALALTLAAAAPALEPAAAGLRRAALAALEALAPLAVADTLAPAWGRSAGPRIAATALRGGGDETAQAKCARDLALFNEFFARQLRRHCTPVAVLNTVRFLLECVVPYVTYPGDTWREVFADWHRSHRDHCPELARPLLADVAELLTALAPGFARVQPICAATFRAGTMTFDSDLGTEQRLRAAFGLALVRAIAPATGRFHRDELFTIGCRHAHASADERTSLDPRLVAHTDTLFDHLDGDLYYWLHEQLPEAARAARAALAASAPEPTAAASVLAGYQSGGTLRQLTRWALGARPRDLAAALPLAAAAAAATAVQLGWSPHRTAPVITLLRSLAPAGEEKAFAEADRALNAFLGPRPEAAAVTQLLTPPPPPAPAPAVALA